LKSGKVFTSKRGTAAADEILKGEESSAYRENDRQMTSAERTQAVSLNPEIPKSITKAKSKNRKRDSNENEQLFCERNDDLNLLRVNPIAR
jgi:hypothetical protein